MKIEIEYTRIFESSLKGFVEEKKRLTQERRKHYNPHHDPNHGQSENLNSKIVSKKT